MADAGLLRRHPVLVGLAGAAVLVAGGLLAFRLLVRDRSDPVSVADALDRYRSEATDVPAVSTPTSAASPDSASTPAPGIYRYRTTGRESVDALGGATHEYPAETTITVVPDGCGVLLRWVALEQRRDEWRLCAGPDGIELQPDGLQYHEFFGQADAEDVRCTAGVLVVPVAAGARAAETQQCMLASDVWLPTWQVLGTEERQVDGAPVIVTHVVMTVVDEDQYDEHTRIDWYLDDHGLPVEARATKRSTSPSPIGAVVYDEEYTLVLESLAPLR